MAQADIDEGKREGQQGARRAVSAAQAAVTSVGAATHFEAEATSAHAAGCLNQSAAGELRTAAT